MSLSLHESAVELGGFCWTERRLFEVLGASVSVLEDPEAMLLVDRHAAHAAWRAEQWWGRLPVLAVIDRDELVVAPSPGVAAVYADLASGAHPIGGADLAGAPAIEPGGLTGLRLLAGFYRVALSRLGAAYRSYRAWTSPVADGPARRTLTQVEADLEVDRSEGEHFVHSLLVNGEAVDAAAASVARLERLLV